VRANEAALVGWVERGPNIAAPAVSFVPRDTHHRRACRGVMGIARNRRHSGNGEIVAALHPSYEIAFSLMRPSLISRDVIAPRLR
jgi:hypothetical protein